MKVSLARFEHLAQHLVEGTFARLRPGPVQPQELVARLLQAMEDGMRQGQHGEYLAPDRYALYLDPGALTGLRQTNPDLDTMLAEHILRAAKEAGVQLAQPPKVELLHTDAVHVPFQVVAGYASDAEGQGTGLLAQSSPDVESVDIVARRAYLLVEGHRVIPLERPLLSLGRQLDNDIVIQDPRVSRRHAQIRMRYGHYVVYDLASRGGTWINEHRVDEHVLQPGDVISLGGAPIIYNEEVSQPLRKQDGAGTDVLSSLGSQSRSSSGPLSSHQAK